MSEDQKANISQLFSEYDQYSAKLREAEAEVERLTGMRSEVVKKIGGIIAPRKKLERGGKLLTIVQRGETAFFRGAGEDPGIFKID